VRLFAVKIGTDGPGALAAELGRDAEVVAVTPEPEAVDAALNRLAGRRLIIDSDLAGLNLVLSRVLRRGELASVETAVLIASSVPYLSACGLPSGRSEQLRIALTGRPRLVGVVRDDSGGLCVEGATLTGWPTSAPVDGWWVRAVVDDQRLCDGHVRRVSVRRLAPDAVQASVRIGRFRRRVLRGRSLQLACDPALIVADTVARERPRSKRTFWAEPKLWQLTLP
jgi:hypothetical protein